MPADVTHPDEVEGFVRATVQRWGGVDILVNNAGTSAAAGFEQVDEAQWQEETALQPHEAHTLRLDSTKARIRLGWRPRWHLRRALEATVAWHAAWKRGADMAEFSLRQIADYSAEDGGN